MGLDERVRLDAAVRCRLRQLQLGAALDETVAMTEAGDNARERLALEQALRFRRPRELADELQRRLGDGGAVAREQRVDRLEEVPNEEAARVMLLQRLRDGEEDVPTRTDAKMSAGPPNCGSEENAPRNHPRAPARALHLLLQRAHDRLVARDRRRMLECAVLEKARKGAEHREAERLALGIGEDSGQSSSERRERSLVKVRYPRGSAAEGSTASHAAQLGAGGKPKSLPGVKARQPLRAQLRRPIVRATCAVSPGVAIESGSAAARRTTVCSATWPSPVSKTRAPSAPNCSCAYSRARRRTVLTASPQGPRRRRAAVEGGAPSMSIAPSLEGPWLGLVEAARLRGAKPAARVLVSPPPSLSGSAGAWRSSWSATRRV